MSDTAMRVSGLPLWDGETYRGVADLEWDGGRFTRVETHVDSSAAGRTDADEDGELSIIPGLIDTHVHFDSYAGSGSVDWMTWPLITPEPERRCTSSRTPVAPRPRASRPSATSREARCSSPRPVRSMPDSSPGLACSSTAPSA